MKVTRSIILELSDGSSVELSETDARQVYEDLKEMFSEPCNHFDTAPYREEIWKLPYTPDFPKPFQVYC